MNREEALLTLGIENIEEDEIQDGWEAILFREKQFFLIQTPIKKVFKKHLEKLQKAYQDYQFLNGSATTEKETIFNFEIDTDFSTLDDILNVQSKLKTRLASSTTYNHVESFVKAMLHLEEEYCLYIIKTIGNHFIASNAQNVAISQKPDIMDIKMALAVYHNSGWDFLNKSQIQLLEKEFGRAIKWLAN